MGFGYSRVCTLKLSENSRNTFHILGKICSTNTDIFLFNLPWGEYLGTEQYNSQKLYFKKPNVLIVLANDEPKRAKPSKDRWVILKISKDLSELTDIVGGNMSKNNGKSFGCGIVDFSDDKDFQMDCS